MLIRLQAERKRLEKALAANREILCSDDLHEPKRAAALSMVAFARNGIEVIDEELSGE